MRRDRRWHARAQPHDGELSLECCVYEQARRQGSGGEGDGVSDYRYDDVQAQAHTRLEGTLAGL